MKRDTKALKKKTCPIPLIGKMFILQKQFGNQN